MSGCRLGGILLFGVLAAGFGASSAAAVDVRASVAVAPAGQEAREAERREEWCRQIALARKRLESPAPKPAAFSQFLYLATLVDPAEGLAMAREVAAMKKAPAGAREQAYALVRQLEKVGQPLVLRRSAMVGADIDLAKWRGKVVLIDFWATWCRPCVAALPALKELYHRRHGEGLEVVGYSLDTDKGALRRFIEADPLPWPVCCDGNGFTSDFVARAGLRSIPAIWIVDKRGVLRDIAGGSGLEEKIDRLLAE